MTAGWGRYTTELLPKLAPKKLSKYPPRRVGRKELQKICIYQEHRLNETQWANALEKRYGVHSFCRPQAALPCAQTAVYEGLRNGKAPAQHRRGSMAHIREARQQSEETADVPEIAKTGEKNEKTTRIQETKL